MIEWMGRYRPVVAALVQHVNAVSKDGSVHHIFEDVYLRPNEWQVLEYIVEHREDDAKMIHMSEALGFHQSYFSKITRTLSNLGLVERFHSEGNKKDIFLKPTDFALTVYDFHTKQSNRNYFKPFFDALESLSDEDLATVTKAITILSENMVKSREDPNFFQPDTGKKKLVKIE